MSRAYRLPERATLAARRNTLRSREAVADAVVAPVDLGGLLKADLVALAESRGLATTGTKAELIARLEAG